MEGGKSEVSVAEGSLEMEGGSRYVCVVFFFLVIVSAYAQKVHDVRLLVEGRWLLTML